MEVLMNFDVCDCSMNQVQPKSQPAVNGSNTFKALLAKSGVSQNVENDQTAAAEGGINFNLVVNAAKLNIITQLEEEKEAGSDLLIEELTAEIVDILEGFGMLKEQNGEIKLNKETLDYIFSTIGKDGLIKDDKMNNLVFGELTGTYEPKQNKGTQKGAQLKQQINELVFKYLSSLENLNDGKGKAFQVNHAAFNHINPKSIAANELVGAAEEKDVDLEKLLGMLKQSVMQAVNEPVKRQANSGDGQKQMSQNETNAKNSTSEIMQTALEPNQVKVQDFKQQSISFAEKLTQHAEIAQKDIADNVTRIIDKMSTHLIDGKHEFNIELKPEHLGKVAIKLISEQGDIKALIKAGTTEARAMIADNLPMLNDALREKGVNVSSIDVVYDSTSFDTASQHFFNQQEESSDGKKGFSRRKGDNGSLEPVTYDVLPGIDIPDISLRNSSVEFKA